MKASEHKTPSSNHKQADGSFFQRKGKDSNVAGAEGGAFFPDARGRARPVQASLTVNEPGDSFEQEAEHTADHVMQNLSSAPPVQRQRKEGDEGGLAGPPPSVQTQRAFDSPSLME